MKRYFKSVDMETTFPQMENDILKLWNEDSTFQKSIDQHKDKPNFIFYDGPPFATGTPHYGHILASTIKDVIPRYQTMKGFKVERRFGWDTHGLPIEAEMQKKLNLDGPSDIKEYGIDKFNEACRANVLAYTEEWRSTLSRLGRWVDFDNDYKTMDRSYMETVWWVFKQLWDKNLIYKGTKVMPYSWKLSTPLSNFEANNYKERTDLALTVSVNTELGNLLIWTTTPWTLPSNLAIAVNPKVEYVKIKKDGQMYFIAKDLAGIYFENPVIVGSLLGKELVGLKYNPIFSYFKDHPNSFKIIASDHVTTAVGTGLVHMAPAYGEDDHRACLANNIEPVDPVLENGTFNSQVADFQNMMVHDANVPIIKALYEKGTLFKKEYIRHQYPYCWRTDTPLIYKTVPVWFVSMEKLKDKLIENNRKVDRWVPEYVGSNRFENWLENTRDWAISRSRFWGTPIPIYECDTCSNIECFGSIAALEEKVGQEFDDIHSHIIDGNTFSCAKCEGTVSRISEVFDCWFESGAMPYAQNHYPFNAELNNIYPADFIAEGLDQTRGWFYTLLAISTALGLSTPYKNVVVNGILLGPDGKKLSKRLKNYTDPNDIMNKYGADSLRAYLLSSQAVCGQDLCFKDDGLKGVVKNTLLPLKSALSFFTQYANASTFNTKAPHINHNDLCELDRWILTELSELIWIVIN